MSSKKYRIGWDDSDNPNQELTSVSKEEPLPVSVSAQNPSATLFKSYEDLSFVTGDSPVVLDILTDLGAYGNSSSIANDGSGNITVAISNDGITYSDEHTILPSEVFEAEGLRLDSIRLTWVSNTAYRVVVA